MNWGRITINLLVMAGVYLLGYISSFIFSKKYAEKKNKKEDEDNEKQK